jgi:hypothetical protein
MSENIRINLGRVGAAVGIIAGVAGLLGAWVLLPYRMEAAEKRIASLEQEAKTARELLVRIDENVKSLKERR